MKYSFRIFFFLLFIFCPLLSKSQSTKSENGIKFLSDSISIYGILENLQKTIYENNPNTYKWSNNKQEIELINELLKKQDIDPKKGERHISKNILERVLPTRYENPITYWLLENIKKDVEFEVRDYLNDEFKVGIATLPFWSLNAKAYNNLNTPDPSIIVVNTGLFNFCHEMIKILLETVRIESKDQDRVVEIEYSDIYFQKIINNNSDLLIRFSKALEDYSLNRTIRGKPPKKLHEPIIVKMVHAMEFFTIAHEYGHLVFNHNALKSSNLQFRTTDSIKNDAFKLSKNDWQQEIESDLFAILMLENYLVRSNSDIEKLNIYSLLKIVPSLFFTLSHIANNSKSIYRDNKKIPKIDSLLNIKAFNMSKKIVRESITKNQKIFQNNLLSSFNREVQDSLAFVKQNFATSHPPDIIRGKYVRNVIIKGSNEKLNNNSFEDLGKQLERNLDKLWSILVPVLDNIISEEENTLDKNIEFIGSGTDKIETPKITDSIVRNAELDSLIQEITDKFINRKNSEVDKLEEIGVIEREKGNYLKSIEYLLRAERLDSSSFKSLFFLGRGYADIGHHNKAIKYFTKANETIDDFHWTYNNRGNSLRRLGKLNEALEDFNKAISLNSNIPLLHINRGLLLFQMGNLDKSIKDYKNGIAIGKNEPYFFNLLAEVLSVKGQYHELQKLEPKLSLISNNKSDLLVYKFFLFTAAIISEKSNSKSIKKQIKKMIKTDFILDWEFDDFNKYISKSTINEVKKRCILEVRDVIIKKSEKHLNKIK